MKTEMKNSRENTLPGLEPSSPGHPPGSRPDWSGSLHKCHLLRDAWPPSLQWHPMHASQPHSFPSSASVFLSAFSIWVLHLLVFPKCPGLSRAAVERQASLSGVQTRPCFQRPQQEQVAGPHLGVQGCPPGVQIGSNGGEVGHGDTAGRQFWEEKVHAAGCSGSKREGGCCFSP